MKEAQYLHSTLYVFDADARTEVIARFNDVVKDTSVRCWYDGEQDVSPRRNTCKAMSNRQLTL